MHLNHPNCLKIISFVIVIKIKKNNYNKTSKYCLTSNSSYHCNYYKKENGDEDKEEYILCLTPNSLSLTLIF